MGRGGSKAKQTKVARDLKYSNREMDLEQLANELHGELIQKKEVEKADPFSEGNPPTRA